MTFVLYKHFGLFALPEEFADKHDLNVFDDIRRDDPELIDYVRTHDTDLTLVEIPDYATDWEITEYDGCESIIYVLDGKLYHG